MMYQIENLNNNMIGFFWCLHLIAFIVLCFLLYSIYARYVDYKEKIQGERVGLKCDKLSAKLDLKGKKIEDLELQLEICQDELQKYTSRYDNLLLDHEKLCERLAFFQAIKEKPSDN